MTSMTINLPDSLRKEIEELAAAQGFTVEQFIASAAGEKLAAMRGIGWLRQQAAAGRREDFDRIMNAVPDVPPAQGDELR